MVDGKENVVEYVVSDPETDVVTSNLDCNLIVNSFEKPITSFKSEIDKSCDLVCVKDDNVSSPDISGFVEKVPFNSGLRTIVVKKVIGDNGRYKLVSDMVEDQLPKLKMLKLNDLSIASNYLNGIKNNILRSDNKNKYLLYCTFFDEIWELLDVIIFHVSKHKVSSPLF